jgi:hypothetical protein
VIFSVASCSGSSLDHARCGGHIVRGEVAAEARGKPLTHHILKWGRLVFCFPVISAVERRVAEIAL